MKIKIAKIITCYRYNKKIQITNKPTLRKDMFKNKNI